jgi:glutathione S-transferase
VSASHVLWWSPDSANLIVRAAMRELGLPYEARLIDRAAGGLDAPGFRALNPLGLLPVLEHDGRVWFETAAILIHLTEVAGRLGPEGPSADDPDARPAFLRWLLHLSNTVHADLRIAFYTSRWVDGAEAAAALRAGVRRRLAAHFAMLDAEIGRAGGWIAGPRLTLADLYLGVLARWAQNYPIDDSGAVAPGAFDPLPQLWALLRAVEERPAFLAACREEHILETRPLTSPVVPTPPEGSVLG